MCTSVDLPLLLFLNNDRVDVRRRPCNTRESALSPNPRKLTFVFVFLSHTSFSVREVLACMGPRGRIVCVPSPLIQERQWLVRTGHRLAGLVQRVRDSLWEPL
jgi:hypothetical protein